MNSISSVLKITKFVWWNFSCVPMKNTHLTHLVLCTFCKGQDSCSDKIF
jgi:hypothetical protein